MARIVEASASFIPALTAGDNVVVANGIGATGAQAQKFVVPPATDAGPARPVAFTPDTLTGMTTLTADLEASSDGGTTWTKYQTSLALIASGVAATVVVSCLTALLYRLNVTAFAGTSASVVATVA
jgi:hypothetical protein